VKKLVVALLLLPLCLSACTPGRFVDIDTPVEDGTVLRVMVSALDESGVMRELEITDYAESYRAQRGEPSIQLDVTTVGEGYDPTDIYSYVRADSIAASYFDTVATKLLAGDDDFDMFFIGNATYGNAQNQVNSMLRKEYMLSMEEMGLAALYDDMLPGVKELCSADGALLLAPVGFGVQAHALRPGAMERLGITAADIPNTLTAFTDFILSMRDKMEAEKVALIELNAAFYAMFYEGQYVTEYMTHGDNLQPMWDALVDAMDRLNASGLCPFVERGILDASVLRPNEFPAIYYTDVLYAEHSRRLDGSQWAEEAEPYIPYMLLTENAKNALWYISCFVVNPFSKNLSAVKAYLSTILDKDFRFAANDNFLERWMIYDNPLYADKPDYVAYKDALAHSVRSYSFIGSTGDTLLTFTDYLAYHRGEMTSAEWKAKVDRTLEFMRDE